MVDTLPKSPQHPQRATERAADRPLRVLHLEDSVPDHELALLHLLRAGLGVDVLRVDSEAEFRQALDARDWDVVLSDFNLPGFNGLRAQQILKAGEAAEKKNLKIAAGLMCRHSPARQALIQKIRDGVMGQIQLMRAYRMESGYFMGPWKTGGSELLWQLRHRWGFLWASSGILIELMVHQVDECCWIKDAWPVAAHGVGGRAANSGECSQNLDSYSIEYTFPDGAKALVVGRYLRNCHNEFATYVHGTKCAAQFCVWGASPIRTHTYKDQRIAADNIDWKSEPEVNPWQVEWNVLLDAIRKDRPHNEARRAAYADLASIMGRAAVHSGKVITWDEAIKSDFQFCPNVASLTADSPAPVHADAQGRYPAPIPGACREI